MVIRINVYRVIPVSDKTLNNSYKLGSTNYVAFYKTALQTKTEKVRKASYNTRLYTISTKLDVRT
jgi:hypothetical protein